MKIAKRFFLLSLLTLMVVMQSLIAAASPDNSSHIEQKAVVFVLDASNSMNKNDPDRLAIDSIAQLIYSLPSNYMVGFVAYHTDVIASVGMVDCAHRDSIMEAATSVVYRGYTNAGAGLTQAITLLDTVSADCKSIVMLSDGEIIMGTEDATTVSASQFANAVADAKAQNIPIHVIGLGADMENVENTIFSASTETKGSSHHAPQATEIQQAINSLLTEQLQIKQTTAAIVDIGSSSIEEINISLPSSYASKVRIMFISNSPIHNMNADFNAEDVHQVSGEHYTLLELTRPSTNSVHTTFQGVAGSQVRVNVITEYSITTHTNVTYTDTPTADSSAINRTANIELTFYDSSNPEQQVLTDSVFDNYSVTGTIGNVQWSSSLHSGKIGLHTPVLNEQTMDISIDFSNLQTNILLAQPLSVSVDAAPVPVQQQDNRPVIVAVGVFVLFVGLVIIYWFSSKRHQAPSSVSNKETPKVTPIESKYSYTGRLNLYITRTKSGYDIPPLTYNLFRIPRGKVLSLQEILDGCNVTELLEGANKIYFRPGSNRCLILSNESDCTVIQNREILMKGRSYSIGLDTKLDITFEDEFSEMVIQYRDVKPSEAKMYAGV